MAVRRPRGIPLLALGVVLALCAPAGAGATVGESATIDGPSADVLELHGVAMAEDGTGGVVYRKRVDGRPHIFVARFANGSWQTPQRVDAGQNFESNWPAIGAGNGGRLVVVWGQDFGAGSDRLYSASLDPGATRFQPPVLVDIGIGEMTSTYPSLAMNAGGQAYLGYRVVTDSGGNLPPGYVGADTRLARYNGGVWSVLGQVADRNPNAPVREPAPDNRPRIAIDGSGNGAVAFQEPDDDFIDRVWMRRIFGSSLGIPLQVSPSRWGDRPLRAPADQIALDMSGFGAVAVAFRQQPGESGALKGTRVMYAGLPEVFSERAGKVSDARIIDGGGDAQPDPAPAAPTVAGRPTGEFVAALSLGSRTLLVPGDDSAISPPERLDDGRSSAVGDPEVDVAKSGALVVAWRLQSGTRGAVGVLERRSDGVPDTGIASGARGGPVGTLLMGGSGLGDAIVAFSQGTTETQQIAAAVVDAPPGDFFVSTPVDWLAAKTFVLRWDLAPSGITGVTYGVQIDDEFVVEGLRRPEYRLTRKQLDNGVHTVQVVASDGTGQQTSSAPDQIKVDRKPPRVSLRRRGRAVTLTISDGTRGETSGVDATTLRVNWGDGKRTTKLGKRMVHRFRSRGRRTVKVLVSDKAGNRSRITRKEIVP